MKVVLLTADSSSGGKYWCCAWDETDGCSYHGPIRHSPQATPFAVTGPSTASQKIRGKLNREYIKVADLIVDDIPDERTLESARVFLVNAEAALSQTAFVGLIAKLMEQSSSLRALLNDTSNIETAREHPGKVELNKEQEQILRQEHYRDKYGAW